MDLLWLFKDYIDSNFFMKFNKDIILFYKFKHYA